MHPQPSEEPGLLKVPGSSFVLCSLSCPGEVFSETGLPIFEILGNSEGLKGIKGGEA